MKQIQYILPYYLLLHMEYIAFLFCFKHYYSFCGVCNNHHEVHEDNEEKKLHALHVLHGKKTANIENANNCKS